MAASVVNSVLDYISAGSGDPVVITLGFTPTSGNALCVFIYYDTARTFTSLTDNASGGSNTYVNDATNTSDTYGDGIAVKSFICKSLGNVPSTLTADFSGVGNGLIGYQIIEVTGQDTGTQPDVAGATQWQNGIGTTANQISSGSVSVATADSLVLGSTFVAFSAGTNLSAGTGFTETNEDPSFPERHASEYQAGVGTGSKAATFTGVGNGGSSETLSVVMVIRSAAGGSSPVLSGATPSGTIGTQTTATIGATTDQASGTFYAVIGTGSQLTGVTAAQIKAGQQASGSAALASDSNAVSTTSPTADITGLTASTAYTYAAIQNNANGDSNIVTGTFTTAAASTLDPITSCFPTGYYE